MIARARNSRVPGGTRTGSRSTRRRPASPRASRCRAAPAPESRRNRDGSVEFRLIAYRKSWQAILALAGDDIHVAVL